MSGRLVLVRHGQSYGNVDRRLDTCPPGSELTPLGRDQARAFVFNGRRPGLVAHSVATRAVQTAAEISGPLGISSRQLTGIHEVQVGALENRNDDEAIAEFNAICQRWYQGERSVSLPDGESADQVLDRYLPVLADLRLRYLDDDDWTGDIVVVSHGVAIRLAAAVLAGVDGGFVVEHHLGNVESVVLAPITDGRWSCVQWGTLTPPFYPEPRRLRAPAANHFAVDDKRVPDDLAAGAATRGAFQRAHRVVDQGAVAVVQLCWTGPAAVSHVSFLASRADLPDPTRRATRYAQPSSCKR